MGIMKGVMALASKKVEEYTKETGVSWNMGNPHQIENERNGYYQDFGNESKGWNNTTTATSAAAGQSSSGRQFNSVSSDSWDDWDDRKEGSTKGVASSRSNDDRAGWDDPKDDGYDSFYRSSSDSKSSGHKSKAAAEWGKVGCL